MKKTFTKPTARLKTLAMSPELHTKVKVYTSQKGMKIYAWTERVLEKAMAKGE